MSIKTIDDSSLSAIANAIRAKNGGSAGYRPSEMAAAIAAISGATLGTKSVTANGTYAASSDSLDGYSSVTVAVANSYGSSDEGKVVSSGALVSQTSRTVTANGTYDTTTNDELTVNVSGGGGALTPDYAGLSYAYLTNACEFCSYTTKTNYMNFYELSAGDTAVCFAESGDRFRVGFFAGKSYQDFQQYVENAGSQSQVYSVTDSVATSGDICKYTAAAAGMLVVMTSASSQTAPATVIVVRRRAEGAKHE